MALSAVRMAKTFSCISPRFRLAAFRSLQEGQTVQFDVTKGPKGWQSGERPGCLSDPLSELQQMPETRKSFGHFPLELRRCSRFQGCWRAPLHHLNENLPSLARIALLLAGTQYGCLLPHPEFFKRTWKPKRSTEVHDRLLGLDAGKSSAQEERAHPYDRCSCAR